MKTVIITGANGNLGIAGIKEFLDKGYKVVATVIKEEMKNDFVPNKNLQVHVGKVGRVKKRQMLLYNLLLKDIKTV